MTPATLPPEARTALALVTPAQAAEAARIGAADRLLLLGAATASGLSAAVLRAGPGRFVVELRQVPTCSLSHHADELARLLGDGWRLAWATDRHIVARKVDPAIPAPAPCRCGERGLQPWRNYRGDCAWCGRRLP